MKISSNLFEQCKVCLFLDHSSFELVFSITYCKVLFQFTLIDTNLLCSFTVAYE